MIQGDPKTALAEPNSVVITETTAKKYFNSTDVVGKSLVVNDTTNFKVTGVIKNIPSQSHLNFDFFFYCSAYFIDCMCKLYESLNSPLFQSCKRGGCKKSIRIIKKISDCAISY